MSLHPHRRRVLCCSAALAAGMFTGLTSSAKALTISEGLRNPCRGALPRELAQHDLVLRAFEGITPTALCDTHCHLLGTGDSGSGCSVHADMHSWWHPQQVLRRQAIMNAACIPPNADSVDRAFVRNLLGLCADFPAGARWLLYALDQAHDDQGAVRLDWTTFHVPNAYAAQVAAAHPERFDWVASVHPYREDALTQLEAALRNGAVAVKWLPSAMNIDLRDRRCIAFYERLATARMLLVVHCGEEKAAAGAGRDELGNPLLVRVPLAHGVRVIVAHAASLGSARDLDRPAQPLRPAFDLWARLMDEADAQQLLYADISALFQSNRSPRIWRAVLANERWHARLLHGSDHPLPGVMPLYAPARLAREGLLDARAVEPLRRIREHNPLLFDFVLKRHLQAGSVRLPALVFETRRLFASKRAALAPPRS